MNEENTDADEQKKLADQEAKRIADTKWAEQKTKELANTSQKQEESRKLLEFILKDSQTNKQDESKSQMPIEEKPIGLPQKENQIQPLPVLESKPNVVLPKKDNLSSVRELPRVPNALDGISNFIKNVKDAWTGDKENKQSDVVLQAISETAVKMAQSFVSREEVRQIAKDASPTDSVPQSWLSKAIHSIKVGASYLTGPVEFIQGAYTTLTCDKTAHPNKITIAVDRGSLGIPSPVVNSITAGTGISGGGSGDVTISNAGVTGIFTTAPNEGLSLSANVGTVHIANTGVKSLAAGTGLIQNSSTGDVTLDADVDDTITGTEPAINMFALTNFSFVAREDGTYLQFAGCRIRTKALTVAGWQEFGPIPGTGGATGVTSIGGLAGTIYLAGSYSISGQTITIGGGGTSGYTGTLTRVTDIQFDGTNLQKKTQTCTYANGLLSSVGAESAWTTIVGGVAEACT